MRMAAVPAYAVRIFALLLIPLSCWQVWCFPGIPNYYLQHFLFYPSAVFMGWAWWQGLWTLKEAWRLVRPALPWLAALLCLQAAAGWESAGRFPVPGQERALSVLVQLIKLLVQLPFMLFFLLLCRVIMSDATARRWALYGALASFALLALLCLVQGIWVYGDLYPSLRETSLAAVCLTLLQTVSPWLEAQWVGSVYNHYANGAYALTLPRFNGFFEEASALSTMLGVFFAPMAFGLMHLRRRAHRVAGALVLALCCVLATLCRSTTGQVLTAVMLGLCVVTALKGQRKMVGTLLALSLASVCIYAAISLPQISAFLKERMLKTDTSSMPRVVITLDTLDIIAEHPVLGVGRGWYFPHLHNSQRYMKNIHDPELRTWKERSDGGELAALPALAAQYGLPALAALFCFVGRTWWLLHTRWRKHPGDALLSFMAYAALAWCVLGLVAGLAALDFRNPLFCLPLYCFYSAVHGLHARAAKEAVASP